MPTGKENEIIFNETIEASLHLYFNQLSLVSMCDEQAKVVMETNNLVSYYRKIILRNGSPKRTAKMP